MEKETAMEILRKLHDSSLFAERTALETLIPELKESEDEKIRKALIRFHKSTIDVDGIKGDDIIAWLEKQGESSDQIHYWTEEEIEPIISDYHRGVEHYGGMIGRLRCLKPKSLEKQDEPQDKGEISDGYHTFNELYYYRMLYNAAFFNMLPKEWVHKSKRHNDGEECFGGGWFIVMANLPTGQISNHYELKDWDLFQIPEKEVADKWDGHTPQEAADRLHKYLLEKQSSSSIKWQKNTPDNKPAINHTVLMKTTIGIVEGEWQGEHWFQYRWSWTLKDSDVLAWMELSDLDEQGEQKHINDTDEEIVNAVKDTSVLDMVEPKFKVGDVLCDKSCTTLDKNSQPNIEILDIRNGMYICNNCSFPISQQYEYELVTKKNEPQSAWSDEDENYLQSAENACEYQYGKNTSTILWLKSLKDRITWKPSKKQMEALDDALNEQGFDYNDLNSLYEQLKKL